MIPGTLVYPLDPWGSRVRREPVEVLEVFVDRFGQEWAVLDQLATRYLVEMCEAAE